MQFKETEIQEYIWNHRGSVDKTGQYTHLLSQWQETG